MNDEHEVSVIVKVQMTPEDWIKIKKDATWFGRTVPQYFVDLAMGRLPRGC